MNPSDATTASVRDLLQQTHGLLAGHLDGDTAVNAALLFTVEAALNLAELREELHHDAASRCDRLREVYQCTRAAATAARFAVVAAEDRRRAEAVAVRGARDGGLL
jgi:hypothetical protein